MKLSRLQKFILRESVGHKARFKRNSLLKFYEKEKTSPNHEDQQNSLTKSIERMIDKELLIGYGRRTPHKWFIDEIKLTAKGKRQARQLLGKQQALPLRLRKKQVN